MCDLSRINRNIVECKDLSVIVLPDHSICINRNIVECKAFLLPLFQHLFPVLIETLWNVKGQFLFCDRIPGPRINRNIVECKVIEIINNLLTFLVLIETLWNVKFTREDFLGHGSHGINRNIVECKVSLSG